MAVCFAPSPGRSCPAEKPEAQCGGGPNLARRPAEARVAVRRVKQPKQPGVKVVIW
jgi:hypothetical protein